MKSDSRPNNKRARFAVICLYLWLGIEILGLLWSLIIMKEMVFVSGYVITDDVMNKLYLCFIIEVVFEAIYFVITVIGIISFIRWFRRAYFNLHLKVPSLQFGEGWAAGAWFIPLLNLIRPFRIMIEMERETDQLLKQSLPAFVPENNMFRIRWWWGLVVTSAVIRFFGTGFACFIVSEFEELFLDSFIKALLSLIFIPTALIMIRILKSYHRKEVLLSDLEDQRSVA